MLYFIIAILIIATNVIMYRVGKRVEKMRVMTRLVKAIDTDLIEQRKIGKAFAKLLCEMKLEMKGIPPIKTDPTPINRDIMKEVDNEYILRNRKTDEKPGHPGNTGRRADDNCEIHHRNQSDQKG